MFYGQNKEPHPFHVKSSRALPIQTSVAHRRGQNRTGGVRIFKPKDNLPHRERQAIKELEQNTNMNVKAGQIKGPQLSL